MRWPNVILPGIFLGVGLGWLFYAWGEAFLLGLLTVCGMFSFVGWLALNLEED